MPFIRNRPLSNLQMSSPHCCLYLFMPASSWSSFSSVSMDTHFIIIYGKLSPAIRFMRPYHRFCSVVSIIYDLSSAFIISLFFCF
jgi:hypothetical protein